MDAVHTTYLVFPEMYKSGNELAKPLSEDKLNILYEATFRACKEVDREGMADMPPSRFAVGVNSRGLNAKSSEKIHKMAADKAVGFGQALLAKLNELDDGSRQFRRAFFFHTLRNLKNVTRHSLPFDEAMTGPELVKNTVEEYFDTNDETLRLEVDIAVEMQVDGHTVLPRRAGLAQLINRITGSNLGTDAVNRAKKSSRIQIIGALYSAAGITIDLGRGAPDSAMRICIYANEKHPTYGPRRGKNALNVHPNYTIWSLIENRQKMDFFDRLRTLFCEHSGTVADEHLCYPIRVEVRFPYSNCREALGHVRLSDFTDCVYQVPTNIWM